MLTDLCTLKFSRGRMLPTYYTNACLFGCMLPFCRWLISVRKSSQFTLGSSRANRHIIQRKVCSVLLSQPVNFLQTLTLTLTDCGVNATKCTPANDFNLDSAT